MRYERGDGTFASGREAAKFGFLKEAGLVIEGIHGAHGERTKVTIIHQTGDGNNIRQEFSVTAEHRNFDGKVHTAFVPSNREISALRRTISMG